MKRILSVITSLLLLTLTYNAQTGICTNSSQSIQIRGFRLGMTQSEITRRYPKIEFYSQDDGNGLTTSSTGISPSLDAIFNDTEREDLKSVVLSLLDKKLQQIEIAYNGFTEWNSLKDFTDAIARNLKIPLAVNWQPLDKTALRLNCKDFFIIVRLEPKRGKYEVQNQSLLISTNDFQSQLDAREAQKKERQQKTFKP